MKNFGCVNNTIRLRSGLYFDLVNPKQNQFCLSDIAGALSKICRFGGQIDRFYSVAEHCVHCANLAIGFERHALMHDAAEAFTGDMVKPLKIIMPQFVEIEKRIESLIQEKYRVDFSHDRVKQIDHAMLIAERKILFSRDNVKWTGEDEVEKLSVEIECWMPEEAERRFLETACLLGVND